MSTNRLIALGAASLGLAITLTADLRAEADPYRGLWVGEVIVRSVNEVTVALDENNQPVAPNPRVPTPTSDVANLRLILHVNGAGQVSLLKDVAILSRKDTALRSENDLALVTDERLYGAFPPQPAVRIASAVYDFGDPSATQAVSAVVDAAVDAVYQSVRNLGTGALDTFAEREAAADNAFNAANAADAAPAVIPTADAATAFSAWRRANLGVGVVEMIATGDADLGLLRDGAEDLEENSFYGDTRGLEMIDAIVDALDGVVDEEERKATARAVASSFADLTDEYQRFLAGESFGDMIADAAAAAGEAGKTQVPGEILDYVDVPSIGTQVVSPDHGLEVGEIVAIGGSAAGTFNGLHEVIAFDSESFTIATNYSTLPAGLAAGSWVAYEPIELAVQGAPAVIAAKSEALSVQVSEYSDKRASEAVALVLASVAESAAVVSASLIGLGEETRARLIAEAGEDAGRETLNSDVPRYARPEGIPSPDYTSFVRSAAYLGSPSIAARAAADAAVFEKANNILATETSVRGQARAAAFRALDAVFSAAARVTLTSLPVSANPGDGGFGPGRGDADDPALEAEIVLAANHPTNPFRHRRHPDHTVGFEIVRHIGLSFDDADSSPSPRAGVGVDRLTGVYREEFFGLHKALGPDPDEDPVGLRVEGSFEIQRVSLIDTLNAR